LTIPQADGSPKNTHKVQDSLHREKEIDLYNALPWTAHLALQGHNWTYVAHKVGRENKRKQNEYLKKLIRIICMVSGVMENLHDLPYMLGSDQLLLFHLLSKNKSSM
jgi:hypothetical protein